MKILVCISNVPDTTAKINFTGDNKQFDKNGVQFVINPWDEYALTRAIELKEAKGGSVTVLNVGEADTEPNIRKALAIGADDAVRVNAHPSDAFFVASQIAAVAKDGGYDMILMGRESIDYNGFQVHTMVGELLGIPSVTPAFKLDMLDDATARLEKEIEGGKEVVEVKLPFVASAQQPMCEPRIPNMRGIMTARTKPLKVVEPVGGEAKSAYVRFTKPEKKGSVRMIDADNAGELISLLRNEAKVL